MHISGEPGKLPTMTEAAEPAGIPIGAGAVAGAVAGGAALGVTELLAGLIPGAPSVVTAIGSLVISLQPAGAKQIVVDLFGTADKLALNLAVALGAVVLTGVFGMVGRRRPGRAALGFGGLAVLGLAASLRDPLVEPLLAVGSAAVGAGVAIGAMRWLLRRAAPVMPSAEMPDWGRRRFVGSSLGVAALAATGGGIGRLLLNQRDKSGAIGTQTIPPAIDPVSALTDGMELGLTGLSAIVTPNPVFYRIDTSLLTPRLDASTWRLEVSGMVDHPFSIDYAGLLAMPMHEEYVTISCVSNEVGGDLVGNALWRGARLSELLARAGVRSGATQVVGRSYDDWTAGFPTAWLDAPGREALVAVAMNGVALPPEHGFPARLIVPGLYGYVSATKWLTGIELTTLEAFDAYWVPLGWAKEAPILTQSRIDVPRSTNGRLSAGEIAVAGVAWAPDRGISRVEVRVDQQPWVEAELSAPISDATWVQWVYRWSATPGAHLLQVRATDGTGAVQAETPTRPAPDGARGYHAISVEVSAN